MDSGSGQLKLFGEERVPIDPRTIGQLVVGVRIDQNLRTGLRREGRLHLGCDEDVLR